jgi:hypothetical protein
MTLLDRARESRLASFDEGAFCAKCGHATIHTRYEPADDNRQYSYGQDKEPREHLRRRCERCGFAWNEAVFRKTLPRRQTPYAKPKTSGNSKKEDVALVVRELISSRGAPMSGKDLYPFLVERGLRIEGDKPDMVLATMLWRSSGSIIRLPKFGYWLAEAPYAPAGYAPGRNPI